MDIVDGTTVLAKTDGYSIIWVRRLTLTREYHTLSSYGHLMDESLIAKCIDDAVERREVHATVSLSDEFFF